MFEQFQEYALSRADARLVLGGASASGKCTDGSSVTCSGANCTSSDYQNVGTENFMNGSCSCEGSNGNIVDSQDCNIQ